METHLLVQGNLAIEVLFRQVLEVVKLLGMIRVHLCHGGVQHGLATRCHLLIFLEG